MKDIDLKDSALIVVDMQVDFLPSGALEVPNSDTIIPIVNEYIKIFEGRNLPVFYSRDWHPEDHCSFKENGGIWPKHCVQNTKGSEFHPDLYISNKSFIISKGFYKDKEAYSAFQDTDLNVKLKSLDVKNVFVCGVATDYCVLNTVLDSIKYGYKTFLLVDAIKGVDVNLNDSEEAIKKMVSQGAEIVVLDELLHLV